MNQQSRSGTSTVEWVDVGEEKAGQRIDNFLITHLKGVPKSRIYRLIRRGEVRVNKGRIKATYRLQTGDRVRIPPVRQSDPLAAPEISAQLAKQIEARVIYEDDTLIILDKASGIAVHGGSNLNYGVIEAFRAIRPNAPFLELVHRLDRHTSGCLMLAKDAMTLRALHEMLKNNQIDKVYLALVQNPWSDGSRRVEAPLKKNILKSGERVVCVDEQGKTAITDFRLKQNFTTACLLEVSLLTGRTHQIRVHATYIGHPIAGDPKYGDPTFNQQMKTKGLNRLFLHAHSLTFQHPATGRTVAVTAPLDQNLSGILHELL